MSEARRPPGRPRSAAADEAIDLACRTLLVEVGFARLTIEAVAERAGVGRPTIYRRWPSKAHMVWDVVFATPPGATVIGDTDDFRADVEVWIDTTIDFFGHPEVARSFPGLLNEQPMDADTQRRLRNPVKERVLARFERAEAEGLVRPGSDAGAIFDLVTGFAIYRAVVPQGADPQPSVGTIADVVLDGVLLPPA